MTKTVVKYIKNKSGLLAAVTMATLVGGLTSAAVLAAIPDSGGTIHGCYRNTAGVFDSKGTLRVINSDGGESCTGQETSLNWDQHPATVVSNRIVIADGTSGQTIINIPQFGTMQVLSCSDSMTNADFKFTNTTAQTMDFSPGQALEIAGAQTVRLAPSDSFSWTQANYGNSISGPNSFIAAYGTSSTSKIATAQIIAVNNTDGPLGGTGCSFEVQAIVK